MFVLVVVSKYYITLIIFEVCLIVFLFFSKYHLGDYIYRNLKQQISEDKR